MRRLLAVAIMFCVVPAARGGTAPGRQRPHPAVARVIAAERGGASYGTGVLVGVLSKTEGLVITNWHVVRDAIGPIMVVFPDGFRSAAAVRKTDRVWDLAALAIWRPEVPPIALADEAPRPGEVLTIAGYGPGWYRAVAGRCIQYVSPGRNQPFEMVELSVPARNGDSGGPILNRRGELAGVLFGAGSGRTTGSYCGRVRWFLASVIDDFHRFPSPSTVIARRPRRESTPTAAIGAERAISRPSVASSWRAASGEPSAQQEELAALPVPRPRETPAAKVTAHTPGGPLASSGRSGSSRAESIEAILAAIGILAILLHGLRLLGRAQES